VNTIFGGVGGVNEFGQRATRRLRKRLGERFDRRVQARGGDVRGVVAARKKAASVSITPPGTLGPGRAALSR